MALYTPESVERVKDAIDMVDLVGAKTELKRSGQARLEGLCPFHDERTPSFGIDPVQKLFHCFGCGEGGDAMSFVMKTEGVDFKGAIELLADRYGIELELEDEDPAQAERRRARERLLELLERTAVFYVRYLWESQEAGPAREYLLGRGLDEAVLRQFRVGYAPSAWDKVLLASRRAGFSNQEIHAAGLAKKGRENRLYDHFRRRITFPLADTRGRVVGFGARAMGDDQKPKYVNTPESELFHKRRHIYAADLARAAAAKVGSVIVTEGYTDVIALHQAGFANAVAIMGTSLTEDQVGMLKRLAPVAHLALDADNAGQEAMLRAARVAGGEQLELRVVPLPVGADPADLVAERGAPELTRLLDRSKPFARFSIERILAKGDRDSAQGKQRIIEDMRAPFEQLPDIAAGQLMRDELVQLVSDRLDLRPEVVLQHLSVSRSAAPAASARGFSGRAGVPDLATVLARTEEVERRFLAFCLALPDLGATALGATRTEDHFTSALTRRAADHLRTHLTTPREGIAEDDVELFALVAELAVRAVREPASPESLQMQRLQLELRRLDRSMKEAQAAGAGGVTELRRQKQLVQNEFNDFMEKASQSG